MNQIDQKNRPELSPGVRLRKDPKTGEPILVFPEGVLFLNPTAHDIVRRCSGELNVADIISDIAAEYEVASAALGDDVLDCLLELKQRKLLRFLE